MSDQYPPRDPYGQQPGPYGQQPWGQQPPAQYGQYGQNGQYGQSARPGPGQPSGGRSEPPLWAPWYGIPFPQAFLRFWKKYVRFDGRASQSEYWFWALWYLIGSAVAGIIGSGFDVLPFVDDGSDGLGSLWSLACALGFIALTVRRLHDVNLSGLLALLFIVPPIGILFSLIIGLMSSNPQGQQYDRPLQG
ncbi:DUF805 domain-containing protein [Curtobacterium flaccumfaciens]|uniref:DUF805 domain-containing protein n=1 Tax=Curtobacterium poinsettiae TaxID=159612 RepID=A0A9Q9T2E7_9MICO|nr:DUF805 domain-containing protein [Curtobacterium flaccumfaciens]UXN25436.1 DUF805 domain-containing protein [Curtobacterium flaccumfaciens]UYC80274.1 DUF805 domain-containing protein [Curtobacterium flaccumfaciens pv. poinsettiae]